MPSRPSSRPFRCHQGDIQHRKVVRNPMASSMMGTQTARLLLESRSLVSATKDDPFSNHAVSWIAGIKLSCNAVIWLRAGQQCSANMNGQHLPVLSACQHDLRSSDKRTRTFAMFLPLNRDHKKVSLGNKLDTRPVTSPCGPLTTQEASCFISKSSPFATPSCRSPDSRDYAQPCI